MMEFSIEGARGTLLPGLERESYLAPYAHIAQYLDRVHARPAYRRMLAKIGKA